jgi:sugar lactone lactonase YvrE
MGEELNRSLATLAERGVPRGPDAVLEEARAEAAGVAESRQPSWRRGFTVAVATAAGALVVIGAMILTVRPFGGEEIAPATTRPSVVSTTFPVIPSSGSESTGPLNEVGDLAFAPDGYLWAGTGGGVVRWDVATGDFVIFTEDDGVPGRDVETLEIAPDGTMWITANRGIGRYDGSWQVYSAENTPELDGQIGALVVDQEGVVWVDVDSEPIVRFDGSWAVVEPPPSGGWPAVMPDGLAVGPDGTLWVGTHDDGVFAFDGSSWRQFAEEDGAPARAPNVIAAPDGTVWAWANGYYTDPELGNFVPGTGFARYDGVEWITYTVDDGLLSNDGAVVVGADGSVTVIHAQLGPDHEPVPIGISQFNGTTWTASPDIGGERSGRSTGGVVGADGMLWVPTASGIVGYDGSDTTELVVPKELATPPILPFTLIPDPESSPVRVSTVIGDYEFTTLRTPGHDVFDTETTPFGWMALGGDTVWRSNDGLTWDAVLTDEEDLWIMADGPDLISYGWGLVRYSWDGAGWTAIAAAEMQGRIQGLAFGPNGAVALVDNTVYYSSDGATFAPAAAGPDLAPVAGRPVGCAGWWPEISVAGPGSGPILVTESGYVLLAPSFGTWNPLPMCEPRAWFSTDGDRWELLTPESPFGESAVADIAVHSGRFVAIGGNDVWVSDDGSEWRPAEVPQLRDAKGIAGGDLGWVLVGVAADSDTSGLSTAMWFSVDGLFWDGPYPGPEGLGYVYFHIEPSVGTNAIISVNGTHDGFVIGRLEN